MWTALRSLNRRRSLAFLVAATLALGIGANTAIFSVVRGVVFRPLPYPESDRLVHIWAFWPGGAGNISFPDIVAIAERSHTVEVSAVYQAYGAVALTGRTPSRSVEASFVTPAYFEILGARAALGRLFNRAEDAEGSEAAVAVLSESAWVREFGADPNVVGRRIELNRLPFEIVGVLPASFPDIGAVEGAPREIFLPTATVSRLMGQPPRTDALRLYWGLARLKPEVNIAAAREDLASIARGLEQERPNTHRGYGLRVESLSDRIRGAFRAPTLALLGGALFILLTGAANVTNLLLLRFSDRRRELSLRAALGASSTRLFRQVFAEALTLSGLGCALGTLLGISLTRLMSAWSKAHVSPLVDVSFDPAALAGSIVVSLITAAAIALVSARAALRVDLKPGLAEGGRGSLGAEGGWARPTLMAAEVTFAIFLLTGAGLMVRSFNRLTTTPLGLNTERLLTFRTDLTGPRYQEGAARARFVEGFLERTRTIPGVESATVLGPSMLGRATWVVNVAPEGRPTDRPDAFTMLFRHSVSPGGLPGLGIEQLSGRDFASSDTADAPLVGIISESVAKQLWPGQDALGRRLVRSTPGLPPITVIGVARDVRHRERYSFQDAGEGFIGGLGPQRDIYFPYAQRPNTGVTFAVRVQDAAFRGLAEQLQEAARSLDPDLPLSDLRFLADRIADQERQPRALALLLLASALIAGLLAATGIYGVISHAVGRRTREIGLRVALGARSRDIARLVASQGARPVAVGSLVGLALSLAAGRFAGSLLFGVTPQDPATLLGVALVVGLLAGAAALVPTRRALAVDPTVALRAE